MKKYKLNIIIYAVLVLLFMTSCEKILDKTPPNMYSDATLWSDVNLADAFLRDCYYSTRHDMKELRLGAVTDEMHALYSRNTNIYYLGQITADNTGPGVLEVRTTILQIGIFLALFKKSTFFWKILIKLQTRMWSHKKLLLKQKLR